MTDSAAEEAEEKRRTPRAPSGLASHGRALWRDVMRAYGLRVDEERTLEAACRLADEIARLEAELATQPTMVLGSEKQPKVNPLFAEVRNHRLALQKLLTALQLPEGDESEGRDRSQRASYNAREMAIRRWGRRGG